MVWSALFECRVARQMWPVSANAIAASIVAESRISPIRMTSGASRIAFFSAAWKLWVSSPTSRWLTIDRLCRCRYSIGSSMVRMCPVVVLLRWSIIEARVVDLPAPVEPTISTRPRGAMMMSFSTCGSCSSSMLGMSLRIARITTPTSPRCWNTFTRKRPEFGTAIAMFSSSSRSNSAIWASFISEYAIFFAIPAGSGALPSGISSPSTLMFTGAPEVRNMSEAFFSAISFRK